MLTAAAAGPQKAKIMNSLLHNKRAASRQNLFEKVNHRKVREGDSRRVNRAPAGAGLWRVVTHQDAAKQLLLELQPLHQPCGPFLQVHLGWAQVRVLIRVTRASPSSAGSSLDSCGGPSALLPPAFQPRPRPLLTGHHRHWGPLKHLLTNSFSLSLDFLQNHVDTPE